MFEVAKKTIMPYKTVNNLISFTAMWYKINELSRKNLTQVQIVALLDVNRSTVRRYQMMSEAEFKERVQGIRLRGSISWTATAALSPRTSRTRLTCRAPR